MFTGLLEFQTKDLLCAATLLLLVLQLFREACATNMGRGCCPVLEDGVVECEVSTAPSCAKRAQTWR